MISFIVIGKNEGDRLMLCLSSIKKIIDKYCHKVDFEVIYVDSKSTDGTIDRIKNNYPEVRIILLTGDCNAAIGRNVGAKEASGDVLVFLDGDMEIDTDYLFDTVLDDNFKMKYPLCNGNLNDVNYTKDWKFVNEIERSIVEKDTFQRTMGGAFIIDRALWNHVGGMDNCFVKSQDIELGSRLTKLGYPVKHYARHSIRHHTIPYYNRPLKVQMRNDRYGMVIVRRNLFSKILFTYSLHEQTMPMLLMGSLVLALVLSFITPYWWAVFSLYLLLNFYRAAKKGLKTFVCQFFSGILLDLSQIQAFLFFYPERKNYVISYKKIN